MRGSSHLAQEAKQSVKSILFGNKP